MLPRKQEFKLPCTILCKLQLDCVKCDSPSQQCQYSCCAGSSVLFCPFQHSFSLIICFFSKKSSSLRHFLGCKAFRGRAQPWPWKLEVRSGISFLCLPNLLEENFPSHEPQQLSSCYSPLEPFPLLPAVFSPSKRLSRGGRQRCTYPAGMYRLWARSFNPVLPLQSSREESVKSKDTDLMKIYSFELLVGGLAPFSAAWGSF